MERYRQERERQMRNSRMAGVILVVCLYTVLAVGLIGNGFTYLDPPPPEESPITIDFTEIEDTKKPKQRRDGTRPRAEEPDPTRETELVQDSKSPVEGSKENVAQESVVDEFGDVETPEPPREKPIDRRALFSAADNLEEKDTLAPQTASEPTDELAPGHASGNIKDGKTTGQPNADLKGRTVIGGLPTPAYKIQESGKVVVRIKVDRHGKVVEAQPGATGTNLSSKEAWDAAKKAAMQAYFNSIADSEGAEFQYGTITYIFNITK